MSFTAYSQTDNNKAAEYFYNGMDKVFKKNYSGAILDFSEAIKYDPGFIQAYENRGVAKYYLQDIRGAIEDYTKALKINPDDYRTCARRGWARLSIQDFKGAIADFTLAIESTADNAQYYNNRGEAKYQFRDYEGAIVDFNTVINSWYSGKEQKSKAFFWRGLVKIDLGQKESGCIDLNKAGKLGYIRAYEAIKGYCE